MLNLPCKEFMVALTSVSILTSPTPFQCKTLNPQVTSCYITNIKVKQLKVNGQKLKKQTTIKEKLLFPISVIVFLGLFFYFET